MRAILYLRSRFAESIFEKINGKFNFLTMVKIDMTDEHVSPVNSEFNETEGYHPIFTMKNALSHRSDKYNIDSSSKSGSKNIEISLK